MKAKSLKGKLKDILASDTNVGEGKKNILKIVIKVISFLTSTVKIEMERDFP